MNELTINDLLNNVGLYNPTEFKDANEGTKADVPKKTLSELSSEKNAKKIN